MLPNIADNIVEPIMLKHIDRTRGIPNLHIDIASFPCDPINMIEWNHLSECMIFFFSGQSDIFIKFMAFPIAKSSSLEIINFNRPVHRKWDDPIHCS